MKKRDRGAQEKLKRHLGDIREGGFDLTLKEVFHFENFKK